MNVSRRRYMGAKGGEVPFEEQYLTFEALENGTFTLTIDAGVTTNVLKNISYSIDGKEILKNISFDFVEGKNYVITGANGCGKSTLSKIIMGILLPTSGQIFFDGVDITNYDITTRANLGIAFAMQQPVRFKGITAKKMLELSSKSSLKTSIVCEYLAQVGLCAREYQNRELNSTLSGGELKRIEIASVLARNAKAE